MTILDRNSGVINAASATWTITRSSGNFGTGTTIAIILMSNTVFTAGTWTQRASSATAMGLWGFDRVGAGEASINITASPAGTGEWFVWELSAGSTFLDGGAAQTDTSTIATYTVPSLTPSAGNRHMLAAAGGNGSLTKSVTSWSDSYTGFGGGHTPVTDFTFSGGADRDVTTAGATAYAPTATFSAAAATRGGVHLAYINNAGDITAPTVPTGLAASVIGSTTADFTWTASTDAVGVTGYELQVIGA